MPRGVISDDGYWNPMPTGSVEWYNPMPTPLPGTGGNPMPSATPGSSPGRVGDISNAGLVNPTLFDNQANRDWWENRYFDQLVNQPHQAMDFDGSSGGDIWGETTLTTPDVRPVSNDIPSIEWTGGGPSSSFGEPIVETPTDANPLPPPADEPLFADLTNRNLTPLEMPLEEEFPWSDPDPFDVPSTRTGGGGSIRSFGNNLTLGEFLNTPLTAMRYGEGYPSPGQTTLTQSNPEMSAEERQWWADHPLGPGEQVGNVNDPTVSTTGGGPSPTGGGGFDTTGMTIIGHDRVTGAPIYRDARGGLHVTPGTGTPVFDPSTQYYDSTGHVQSIRSAGSFRDSPNQGGAYGQGSGGADKSYMVSQEVL